MRNLKRAASEFLALDPIAVVGVSRDPSSPANLIYRKLKETGHRVFAVNPKAREVEGDRCYANLATLPAPVEGVVIVTPPEAAAAVVDDCAAVGVRSVWMHRSFGHGSVSREAVDRCRRHGISVIPGGCPMMHCAPVDRGHACMRAVLRLTGKLPVPLSAAQ